MKEYGYGLPPQYPCLYKKYHDKVNVLLDPQLTVSEDKITQYGRTEHNVCNDPRGTCSAQCPGL